MRRRLNSALSPSFIRLTDDSEKHRGHGGYNPAGLQMHSVVEGRLTCWGICEQGYWWGLVTYDIAYGARRKAVTHWIPAWTLKQKAD